MQQMLLVVTKSCCAPRRPHCRGWPGIPLSRCGEDRGQGCITA